MVNWYDTCPGDLTVVQGSWAEKPISIDFREARESLLCRPDLDLLREGGDDLP